MKNISKIKIISYYALLAMVCVLSFLTAKYIIENNINGEESPIDTSTKLN